MPSREVRQSWFESWSIASTPINDMPFTGMTVGAGILGDGFERVKQAVAETLDGISPGSLSWRPDHEANTIAWLIWHLTRVQDDHLAAAFGVDQVWHSEGWMERFGLPFADRATGYGQSPHEVRQLDSAPADLLSGYHNSVANRTASLVSTVSDIDLERVVDERWEPPVTLGVRLVSVIADDLQHVGQAAYLRGLAERGLADRSK